MFHPSLTGTPLYPCGACLHAGCSSEQFTCGNGQCIPLERRCDRRRDCRDGSDEDSCRMCRIITLATLAFFALPAELVLVLGDSLGWLCFFCLYLLYAIFIFTLSLLLRFGLSFTLSLSSLCLVMKDFLMFTK